ncbi:type II secretion system minor pseudopilin GspK [Chitinimonas sp.]|uniref:type II secretion system minor pseudopilin GspK n=1 Tax=Chitinimonas sp. TaxID=1934313 RepID=UPI002F94754A
MMYRSLPRQSGIAIVTAVAVAALVAALAGFMAFRHSLWLRQVENQHDLAQARGVARAAIDLSRLTLRDDARQNKVDHAQEAWAIPIPNLPVEQGNAGGKISDLQGRFNLNNLIASNGQVSMLDKEAYERLLKALGLSPETLVPPLLDWLDADSEPRYPGGAEDREYLAGNPPHRAANRPLFDIDELRQVQGYSDEIVARLAPFVSALPQAGTQVNVNFAPPEVLSALLPSLDLASAQALARRRDAKPFSNDSEFKDELSGQVQAEVDPTRLGYESRYFLADVDARFGRVTVAYRAMLERNGDQIPRVVWMRRR